MPLEIIVFKNDFCFFLHPYYIGTKIECKRSTLCQHPETNRTIVPWIQALFVTDAWEVFAHFEPKYCTSCQRWWREDAWALNHKRSVEEVWKSFRIEIVYK